MRFFLLVLTVFMGILSRPVLADESADYAKFMKDNYYLLDDQQFSKIKCKISVPFLDRMLIMGRQQLQMLPGKVVIDGNMKDFSLVYNKKKGLSFIKPDFNIKALEPAGITNQQTFDQGAQAMKMGLKNQVDGVTQIIVGLFDEYTLSNKKKVQSFLKTASGAEVTLEKNGMVSKEKYSDSSRISELSGLGSITGTEETRFEKINNDLVLSKSNVHIQQAGGEVVASLEVSYANAGSVPFPKSVMDKTSVQMNGLKQEIEIDVNLDECTAE